ncbi:MAG: PQQ-dependent sugar dehydrogenase [Pseudomonadota bacterium]
MIRTLAALCFLLPAAAAAQDIHATSAGDVRVERMVSGLSVPWSLAFLPDGGKLITERDGSLLHFTPTWTRTRVSGVPSVYASGQGGLLDVQPARDFAETREIFLSFSAPRNAGAATTLVTARLSDDNTRLEAVRTLFAQRDGHSGRHYAGRILEAEDGILFLTLGDLGDRPSAQDTGRHNGKLIRINRDGSAPADNPFLEGPYPPEVWTVGHRNPQGLAVAEDGTLWTNSHGARGGDEINLIEKGKNYGWPVISYGRHYSYGQIGEGTAKPGLEQPKFHWDPSIAPSGMVIYSGKLFPDWAGDMFVGSLKFDMIARLDREGREIKGEERLFEGDYNRIRDVREGPDGAIWFLSEGDDALYRITPAEES